ncbi:MAG: metal-dependent transcriptional regulator [Bacilli bacterium]|nr:metal-dependent transcriptional regulator [Bacilli bacterium]
MKLYESSEDYLETVLILKERNGNVHAIDIAREMGFSKPSVSIAIHKLEDNGYLTITEDGNILLTESGSEIANKIYDRHLTISKALTMLGVNEEQSLVDACKIEHDISEETFAKLKEFVKKHEQ